MNEHGIEGVELVEAEKTGIVGEALVQYLHHS